MSTEVRIEGERILINGEAPLAGRTWNGRPLDGLLLNARMIQAVTDDENPATARRWAYPDTGRWDPERNTDEFCAMLPVYRAHGLRAVTVGLQGGGSVYTPEVWNECVMSGFAPDGSLKPAWAARLRRVLAAADACGMVVIVNLFYWKQIRHLPEDRAVVRAVETAADWLLRSGFTNVLLDVANESAPWWTRAICRPEGIAGLIRAARAVTLQGRELPVGSSTGGDNLPTPEWLDAETVSFPHGNGNTPERLRERLRAIREAEAFRRRPRPLLINEDGVNLENMKAALEEGASWGYYAQGAGSRDPGYDRIWPGGREAEFERMSGFQTLPVNWAINDASKREFFGFVAEVSGSRP